MPDLLFDQGFSLKRAMPSFLTVRE
jgi:hypothetical protein